jgi:leucyl aminopeptidase
MLKFTTMSLKQSPIDTLAVPICQDAQIHSDPAIFESIAQVMALEEFEGEKGQLVTLYNLAGSRIRRCIFIGLGKRIDINAEGLRIFAGQSVKAAHKVKGDKLVLAMPDPEALGLEPSRLIIALFEGACLANHAFEKYKEKPKQTLLKQIELWAPTVSTKRYRALPTNVATVCQGTLTAREWINTPSNDKPPEKLAKIFLGAGKKAGLNVSVLHQAQLQRQKFGALLAVAAGSANPPCLVEMALTPPKAKQTVVLVGKGVTFDSGGISLKPAANMDAMKADMSGAACVAATLVALAKLHSPHRVVGLMPLVENMPSGQATRPGDVVTSYAGKTVEIGNTDAEGRLILIDAMAYAIQKYKPDVVIDLATLTGACVVALGEKIAGVFSKDDSLAQAILDAAEATQERCWRLPLPADYLELLKSDVADINNMSSTRYGGAITAALFLSEFVGDTRWAHIDIAGPAFAKKAGDYCGPGGVGFGVRLLCDLIQRL